VIAAAVCFYFTLLAIGAGQSDEIWRIDLQDDLNPVILSV
jgi:hypothetical protein